MPAKNLLISEEGIFDLMTWWRIGMVKHPLCNDQSGIDWRRAEDPGDPFTETSFHRMDPLLPLPGQQDLHHPEELHFSGLKFALHAAGNHLQECNG